MESTAAVALNISGVALARALHSMHCANGDIEGLLLGSRSRASTLKAADFTGGTSVTTLSVSVDAIVPLGAPLSFYDAHGRIDDTRVEEALKGGASSGGAHDDRVAQVVGWWKFRRGATGSASVSFRESLVHTNLAQRLSQDTSVSSTVSSSPSVFAADFVFGLFTSQLVHALLQTDYVFLQRRGL